ncbi:hypothetical protein AKJ64_02240 [candidate division MSBL1 archaeon SCGC-AAA259E17]|uniref:Transposase IS4-like domain-containing protein n=1 Tax=candidate division MSBL1 archaeon SCGC-AAA259E17 TaxID=1698263 RepID=A0A133UEZ2_9EURY|nr:hypothetical protein AKJ64_02240 [candidate division MSBL1 archaeon SCGC-AAA259E17]
MEKFIGKLKNDEIDYEPPEGEDSGVDWSSYDKAQVNELKNMLSFVKKSVDEAVNRLGFDNESEGRGRPSYSAEDLAKGVLLQQYFEVSNRVAAGFVDLFKEKLGIEEAYSYKTLERAYDNPHVAMILREVFEMSQESVKDEEDTFSPDGTGIPNSIKGNWEKEKDPDDKGSEKFTQMIAMMGATYQLISSVKFPDNPKAHESPYFEPLLEETADRYVQIDLVSMDSAYLSRDNCDLVEDYGGTPCIHPKEGITLKRKGSWAWTEMLLDFIENPQQWLREYHTRSNVESGFSTFKRHFLSPLRKCIGRRRKTEAFARACDYNLKRASYIRRQEGLTTPWMAA